MKKLALYLILLLAINTVYADDFKPQSGWYTFTGHPNTGVNIEFTGDNDYFLSIFAYNEISGMPIWFSAHGSLDHKYEDYMDVMIYTGGSCVFGCPGEQATSVVSGTVFIKFTSSTSAVMVFKGITVQLTKFYFSIPVG